MSADDEKATILEEKLKDITDCCICLETYKEPKILPCIHTFCLNCLEGVGTKTNRCPSNSMPCPICRKEFTIPEEGFVGLQINFFMERLVEIGKVINPSVDRTECDLCSEDVEADNSLEIPLAEIYCADCHQKLCQECSRHHRKSKLSKNHKFIALDDQTIHEDSIGATLPTCCGQHIGKPLEIYCSECQETVCSICFFDIHKTHNGLHISNIVDDFREKIRKNKEDFPLRVNNLIERRKTLENDASAFLHNTEEIEIEINCARDELKHLVDEHSESLLKQLTSLKLEKLKYTEIQKDEIDMLVAGLESYETYCNQLTVLGSASDICRAAHSLDKRADDLNHMYKATEEMGLHIKKISLRKEEVLEPDKKNVIGHIEERDRELCSQTEAHSEPADSEAQTSSSIAEELSRNSVNDLDESNDLKTNEELKVMVQELEQQVTLLKQEQMERERVAEGICQYNPTPSIFKQISLKLASTDSITVTGLAILDNELFISTRNSADIEVYNTKTYDFKRLWCVSKFRDPWDICSCALNNCLYIAFGNECNSYNNESMRFSVESILRDQQLKDTEHNGAILKVDHNGIQQHFWSISACYSTLSNTVEGNVILTIPVRSQLVEYDTNGVRLREINISSYPNLQALEHSNDLTLICPSRALKLSDGKFLMTYFIFGKSNPTDSYYRYKMQAGLCKTDYNGQIISKFSGKRGSGFGELCEPWHMAVDENTAVLVLERGTTRISLLNPNMEYKRKLISKKHGLSNPYRLCFDEENGRLLVANSSTKTNHVLVSDIKTML